MRRNVLLVVGPRGCVPVDPLLAARRRGCGTIVLGEQVSTECLEACGGDPRMESLVDHYEPVSLRRPDDAVRRAIELQARMPISAVMGYNEITMPVVAEIAERLGLVCHPRDAVLAACDKPSMKERLLASGIPTAPHHLARDEDDAAAWAAECGYPVVVKPVRGGSSQGVIRADDEAELRHAYRRVRRIVRDYALDTGGRPNSMQLVEKYLEGAECSVEVIVSSGEPHVVAVCGKPDPLVGPFFEELCYVTPMGLAGSVEREVSELAARTALALGLTDGPGHCEIRVTPDGPYVIEMAGRLLGGSCARLLQYGLGEDIYDVLLRQALGEPVAIGPARPDGPAAGAMMLPIPGEGRLVRVVGLEQARSIPGVTGVSIRAALGDVIVPFPEQRGYMGVLEATAPDPIGVRRVLAEAASKIRLDLAPITRDTWTIDLRSAAPRPVSPGDEGVHVIEGAVSDAARQLTAAMLARSAFDELPPSVGLERARAAIEDAGAAAPPGAVPVWVLAPGRGVALGYRYGDAGHVCHVGVLPERRGRGAGEGLVRTLLAVFAARGCATAAAETDPRLEASARLMNKLGFRRQGLLQAAEAAPRA